MQQEFWLERWERNEIGFHQGDINAHLQRFWGELNVEPNATVFVPLCGKSQDLLWLRGQGHPVLGVEISPLAVEAFFAENGLSAQRRSEEKFESCSSDGLEILCGDFFDLDRERLASIGAVYDRASLVALPPEMRSRYAEHLKQHLPPMAQVLLVTMDYDQNEMDGPPFSVSEKEVRELYEDRYTVSVVYSQDILDENPRFKERGLTRMQECVYRLAPK